MELKKNNIYRRRFESGFVFLVDIGWDDEEYCQFIDMKTFELVNLFSYEVYDDICDLDEVDDFQLQSDLPLLEESNEFDFENNTFRTFVKQFLETDKRFEDLQECATRINDAFYRRLDSRLFNDFVETKEWICDEVISIRNDQKDALNYIYRKAVLVV